ncbi:hypothetical protein EIN_250140 [Entamoeba invadens IP1]|uniref:Major facilitator superfamily (MFS) profile domain-containing protein n=1 Tax=Entamoeba invadens IP1 TaxID=370355 RepID=A0A0A1UEA8_ENTIV|nr:hypothetical protein EIN_250140 [Entamoeba invadens IP1]ELP94920.1 hypothetical protein EIN_250140 [Entamoeba invadens IP1]|eukprot:XP_004261691.1 hypothetical protein EIN_250140 [Entamoeba invadens IP1]
MYRFFEILLSPFTNIFPKGFPVSKLIPLLILQICESFVGNSIGSYSGFMVMDFGMVSETNDAGFYSGLLSASFQLAQFISSFFLGVLSDNIGRRPILLFGSCGSFIATIMFGFSFNFWWAVVCRFISGFVNGNIGVIKTFMGEFSNKENRAQVFGLIGLTNGFGMIIGSALGGYLARPCIQYPKVFGGITFFETFPYILPNIVCACFTLIGVVLSFFYLQETKPREKTTDPWYIDVLTIIKKVYQRMIAIFKMAFSKEYQGLLCCVMYGIIGTQAAVLWSIIPLLFMASDEVGGFGWGTDQMGNFAMVSAIGIIVTQMFIYRPVVNKIGVLWTNRIGSIGSVSMFPLFPSIHYLSKYGKIVMWCGIVPINLFTQMTNQFCFASVMALIANSVKSDLLGTLNGLSQSMVAFLRMVAPLGSTPLFAWSLGNQFPLNIYFPFFCFMAFGFIDFFASLFLPKSINFPKEESLGKEYKQVPEEEMDNNKEKDGQSPKIDTEKENIKEEQDVAFSGKPSPFVEQKDVDFEIPLPEHLDDEEIEL